MTSDGLLNRRVTLRSRPVGVPTLDDFLLVESAVPEPREGEVLLRTRWLSIEPYMRLGMGGSTPLPARLPADRLEALSMLYKAGIEVGAPIQGATVSEVVRSRNPRFSEGDIVLGYSGWQDYAIDDGTILRPVDAGRVPASTALGVLGIPGMTAYTGLVAVGEPKPGETVVVSAALGAVGSVVGQIARIKGARAVGIASGAEKCRSLVEEMGFTAAVDRTAPDFERSLAACCPDGIDLYFENAGGAVFWAVFPLLNDFARIPISGLASHYSHTSAPDPVSTMDMLESCLLRRIMIKGLYVFDFAAMEPAFIEDMTMWIESGAIRYREHVVSGLEQAPQCLLDVLAGRNVGKMLVSVS